MTITWSVKKLKLSDLTEYKNNPRRITKDAFNLLVKSLKEDGYHSRLLVNLDNVIIGGHARLKALQKAGYNLNDEIEVLVPNRLLEGDDFDRINIRDNLTFGDFDTDMLCNFFDPEKLSDWGMPDSILGVLDDAVTVTEEDDEVPELDSAKEPTAKLGDVWQLGEHRLMCGDSTSVTDVERLMGSAKADMVFTDPPYGYSYESNHYKKGNPHGMLENDDKLVDFIPLLNGVLNENAAVYICGSHQTINKWRDLIEKEFTYKNTIVWKKNNWSMGDLKGAYACQHELILFAHKGRVELNGERHRDVWEFDRDPPENHPTQKPVELITFALANSSHKNDKILDLFGGSGSTLIACEKSKRKCLMMELSPHYVDVIIARWEKLTGKKAELLS